MKTQSLLMVTALSIILSGCSQIPFLAKKQSALQISSNPQATVSIGGTQSGQTPFYDDKLKPGTYTVRLFVESDPSKDWQTEVTLAPSVVTVISHQFGVTNDDSSSYILTLEPITQKDSSQLDVTSIPENVIVKVDGRPEGFSPLHLENVSEGDHTLTLTAPGYQEMNIKAQTQNGYKLIATAMLAKSSEVPEGTTLDQATPSAQLAATPSAKVSSTPTVKPSPSPKVTTGPTPKVSPTAAPTSKASTGEVTPPYVTIKNTGTTWLRVRSTPSGVDNTNEIARVDVGGKYPYIESSGTGWFKIEYESGKQGWIASQYATLTQ